MNKERFFLINRGDLEERFDVQFYVGRENYEGLEKLGRKIKVKGGKRIPLGYYYSNEPTDYLYLRVENIDDFGEIDYSNFKFITKEVFEILKRYELKENELIFSIAGTIGRVGIFRENDKTKKIILTENCAKILIEDKGLSADYLKLLFQTDLLQKQINKSYIQTTIPKLGLERIYKLKAPPIPSLKRQAELVEIFKTAIEKKKAKETRSIELLTSIDTYLLNQLDIIFPQQPENTIENRIFKTGWQKVTGNRLDPKKYSYQSESLIACIENSKLRKVPLKSLVIHSVAGDWGVDEKEEVNSKLFTKCLVIRATEFDNDYNLNIENSRAKFRLISNTKLKKLDIKPQDFLLEKSGGSPDQPVGRISILENELLANNTIAYSNFIHKFRINTDEVLPEFLFCFLKTIHNIKLTDVMQSQTNGIRNLIMREYWNQSIILPDKKKQKEIADTIYQMRAEAKQTEIDAQEGFEQTKKEIEKLILK